MYFRIKRTMLSLLELSAGKPEARTMMIQIRRPPPQMGMAHRCLLSSMKILRWAGRKFLWVARRPQVEGSTDVREMGFSCQLHRTRWVRPRSVYVINYDASITEQQEKRIATRSSVLQLLKCHTFISTFHHEFACEYETLESVSEA